ncbi:MAG TPA: sulfopyruvate decarboxylase subunit alpha [Dehalococcoidia bacterium]|nr:sulfopyruvate decarboxylase subunit alpha [Dehalococcoidia bacterium]
MADPEWSQRMADGLRRNGIRFYATVPDFIVSQVLEHLWRDEECTVVTAAREEEALGILSGAYLAGKRGALLMQNSGLGNCVNTLASLNFATQIPVVMVISHRGDINEYNPAQVPMGQAAEGILQTLGVRYIIPHTVGELEAQLDGLIKLAYTRSLPVAVLLPNDLTGGRYS